MRLGGLSAWTSLACFGATLTVISGCQLPVSEENESDPNETDGSQFQPGTDPNGTRTPIGNYPSGSAPAPRKLALDLTGVAGFAILDDDSQDGQLSSPGLISGGGSAPAGGSSAIWLESTGAGQLLVRKLSGVSLARVALTGAPGSIGGSVPELSQEDPGATPTPTSGDAAAPAPGTTSSGTDADVSEQAGLLKITDDGRVLPALVALAPEPAPAASTTPTGTGSGETAADQPAAGTAPAPSGGTLQQEPLPRVTALGLSPDGSVYVLFEHGFTYRQPTAEETATQGFDPYSPQSPLRCQLFRADGSWKSSAPDSHDLAELQCVTSQYQVPTWDARRVMQFDASGKLYFRAVTQANPQGVFLQFDPTTQHVSEKVNANICWMDVQVTPRGSLFYTGSTGTNGACGGTSFFRYVSADNRLTEIARDWWNFKYLAERDPADPNNERIIFYGPDPNSASTDGWATACLYRYNPAIATPANRTQKLLECYRDGWSYVSGQSGVGPMPQVQPLTDDEVAEYRARCESEGQLFFSGDSVQAISQLDDGTLLVVGTFQRKLAGQLSCGIQVNFDHCKIPGTGGTLDTLDEFNLTEEACTGIGHEWVLVGEGCSNRDYLTPEECDQAGEIWTFGSIPSNYQATGDTCLFSGGDYERTSVSCNAPGPTGSFSQDVEGLAYLVAATDDAPAHLELLSEPSEHVERYWAVPGADGAQLFYSVYSAGQYNLRVAKPVTNEDGDVTIERKALLEDYEVYNLQRDPAHPERVLFDALQFSTNSYLFGSIDPSLATPEDVQASLQLVNGVSGKVETLIILPDF